MRENYKDRDFQHQKENSEPRKKQPPPIETNAETYYTVSK